MGIFMSEVSISQICELLIKNSIHFDYVGDEKIQLVNIQSLDNLTKGSLGFYRGSEIEFLTRFVNSQVVLIVKYELKEFELQSDANVFYVENPDLVICIIGKLFLQDLATGIHFRAIVDPSALIAENTSIGANSIIGADVVIGHNVIIEEDVVLKHCTIGDNCHIHSGVKVGRSGLGSHRDSNGVWHHFPHFGRVVIGNNVIVQDNSVIARGSLTDTIIHDGVIIGPLTLIAHNVVIDKNVFITQAVTIAGSVKIGEGAIIWGNASIRDGLTIGNKSTIGMGSVVVKNVEDNTVVIGNPAKRLE
jgi:UDP-3-O-[3-hydroxymyristoyl] glucosamine N-acyltransferase